MTLDEVRQYYVEMFKHEGFKNIELQKSGEIDILMEGHKDGVTTKCGVSCRHADKTITRDMINAFYMAMLSIRYGGQKEGYIISRVGFTPQSVAYGKEINRAQTSFKIIFITEDVVGKYEHEVAEQKRQEEEAAQKASIQQVVDLYEAKLAEISRKIESERQQLNNERQQIAVERKALADKMEAIQQDELRRMENFNRKLNKLYHESLGKHFIAVLRDDLGFARLLSKIHPKRFKLVFYLEILVTLLVFAAIVLFLIT